MRNRGLERRNARFVILFASYKLLLTTNCLRRIPLSAYSFKKRATNKSAMKNTRRTEQEENKVEWGQENSLLDKVARALVGVAAAVSNALHLQKRADNNKETDRREKESRDRREAESRQEG
jgi:hypothetical protein